jgi:Immunity protein 35
MLDIKSARNAAEAYLEEMASESQCELALVDVVEKPYGWIFSYQSKEFLKSRNPMRALAGNAPF